MAGSLPKAHTEVQVLSKVQLKVCELMAEGVSHVEIARKLAKGDAAKAKVWRSKFRRWARNPHFQQEFESMQRAEGLLHIGPSIQGVGRRAARGRVDAAKLLWSMTGFHNDKVSHEHSGGIEITVNIPRPKPTEDHLGVKEVEQPYVDADVVED